MTKYYRSRSDKRIAGLCGGLAEMLDIDPTLVRLGAVLICFVTGVVPVLITYLVAWWIVPYNPDTTGQ